MKIGSKLNLAFIALIVLMLISTVISFISLSSVESKMDEALNNRVQQIKLVDDIRVNLGMQGLYARALIIDPTDANEKNLKTYADALDQNLADLANLVQSQEMTDLRNLMLTHNDNFNTYMEELIVTVNQDNLELANIIVTGKLQDANVSILTEANTRLLIN